MNNQSTVVFEVQPDEQGRIDLLLRKRMGGSRRQIARLMADGLVRVDGRVVKKGVTVGFGARISVAGALASVEELRPLPDYGMVLSVLHQDDDLVAVNKPAGMHSHPLRSGERGSLANGVVARFAECIAVGNDPREAGLVQRLDASTSGVLLVARNQAAYLTLRNEFSGKKVSKEYLALVEGEANQGSCELPIAGQDALTEWTIERRFEGFTLLRCRSQTGRRHQVRQHLARVGTPIAGDQRYGARTVTPDGAFLHAERLHLSHPRTRAPLSISAPLPEARANYLAALKTGPDRY